MIKQEKYTLYNGVQIPKIGFGTWQTPNDQVYEAVTHALNAGYRHIDTAVVYENEIGVGKAIKDSGIAREELFITTKIPADIKTYEEAKASIEKSLVDLGLDYIDLHLIHAPWPWSEVGKDCKDGNVEVWKALIEYYNAGKIRSIGVSNFHVADIEYLIEKTNVKPMVNQIRFFIGNTQEPITQYCQANNILIEAYSPMATGELISNEIVQKIADKYNTTNSKICLRYCIERNTLPLPKSVTKSRIYDNIDLDFEISKEDMKYLDDLYHIASTRKMRD